MRFAAEARLYALAVIAAFLLAVASLVSQSDLPSYLGLAVLALATIVVVYRLVLRVARGLGRAL